MRHTAVFPIDDLGFWKKQLLHWVAGHEVGAYLDSNEYSEHGQVVAKSYHLTTKPGWECLAAADAAEVLEANAGDAFERLRFLRDGKNNDGKEKNWLFGFLGYDLKNEVEQLFSQNFDGIVLPDMGFFRPKSVAVIRGQGLEIQTEERMPEEVFFEIKSVKPDDYGGIKCQKVKIELQPRIPKTEYLQIVEAIRQHIIGGDIYEMNFCQEFFAKGATLHPVAVFERLNGIGKAPFSTFLRWRDRFLLSASPERFLKKEGQKLISQPIKGTRRRGRSADEDEKIKQELATSEKDRAENVMIVDLVRNDLARQCLPGSVLVDELCGIYSFATVHQMISTVSGTLPNDAHWLDALRDAFPMGSMTGAPKVMAMELIERYERSRRGLYSGAVGYISPDGDFDFNVVIRSILCNAATGYVSVQVGGAIVFDSVPEQEYEECMVKLEAMLKALGDS
ncbi:MAG: anthranilate synthase component I family protein [Saprospiraceae bacterium]